MGVRYPARLRPLILACVLAGAGVLVLPRAAAATVYYVTEPGTGHVLQYRAAADGTLSDLGAANPSLLPESNRIAVTGDDRWAFVAQEPFGAPVLQFYKVAAGGALSANGSGPEDLPTGVAVHPSLPVMYFAGDNSESGGTVYQRDIQSDGTAAAPGTSASPSLSASGPSDVAVRPNGQTLYAAYNSGTVDAYALDPSSGEIGSTTDSSLPGELSPVQALAVSPGGANLYVAVSGVSTFAAARPGRLITEGPAVVHYPIAGDGSLGSPDATGLSASPRELAVSPDGRNVYASVNGCCAGQIDEFSVGDGGSLASIGSVDAPSEGSGSSGVAVSPDGRSVYLASQSGGLGQFDRASGGTLSPKDEPVAPGSDGFTTDESSIDVAGIAVLPPQAPIARLAASVGFAGSPTQFDGSHSSDPDGSVARYDWNFGDGAVDRNAGPFPIHTFANPGHYTVTLTVTDADGTSIFRIFTGRQVLRNGAPRAQATSGIDVPAHSASGPQPDFGHRVLAEAVLGTVLVRLPGSSEFVPLESVGFLPVGTTFDVRKGRVRLTVENAEGHLDSAIFYGGIFKLTQYASIARRRKRVTELRLRGRIGSCSIGGGSNGSPGERGKNVHIARRRHRRRRRLWGRGRGRFRTRGRHASATVRGTTWLTEDACDPRGGVATITFVKRGKVTVRDFVRHRTIVLTKGKRYVARVRRR